MNSRVLRTALAVALALVFSVAWADSPQDSSNLSPDSSAISAPSVTNYDTCQKGVDDYLQPAIEAALSSKQDRLIGQRIRQCESENSLETANIANISAIMGDPRLPPQCLFTSMKGMSPAGGGIVYGQCGANQSRIVTTVAGNLVSKPCLTPEYHALVYRSYMESMDCLGLDPKEMFPVFALESGFQANIGNMGGDWGIAQLSPSGVEGIDWAPVLAKYRSMHRCDSIHDAIAEPISSRVLPCERAGIPGNPARSFVYGGYLYLENKLIAQSAIQALLKKRASKGSVPLSDEDVGSLTVELTRYMYNGGAGGVAQAFRAFVQEGQNASLSHADLSKAFSTWLSQHFGEGVSYFKTHQKMLESLRQSLPGYTVWAASYAKDAGPGCAK